LKKKQAEEEEKLAPGEERKERFDPLAVKKTHWNETGEKIRQKPKKGEKGKVVKKEFSGKKK